MLSVPSSIRIFISTSPTDMRKQFDGLSSLVTQAFGKDVMTGDYFVFVNRAKNRCKVLCWDRDGFALWAKRLEQGRFQLPRVDGESVVAEIDATTLAMILGGVDLHSAKRRKRFQVASSIAAKPTRNSVVLVA